MEEIFIRELRPKERANPTRHITEEEFPKKAGMIVVYKPYGEKGKGFYYVKDKKENSMETIIKNAKEKIKITCLSCDHKWTANIDPANEKTWPDCPECGSDDLHADLGYGKKNSYQFSREGSDTLLQRGLHAYGTKKDNAVCECPDCYGGGRLGLFACKNCRGTGKVIHNDQYKCKDCGHITSSIKTKCSECGGSDFVDAGTGKKVNSREEYADELQVGDKIIYEGQKMTIHHVKEDKEGNFVIETNLGRIKLREADSVEVIG